MIVPILSQTPHNACGGRVQVGERGNFNMMYMPIWILYLFSFIYPIPHLIKVALVNFALWISKKIFRKDDIYRFNTIAKASVFSILAEIIGVATFCVIEMNTETVFYYDHYMIVCIFALVIVTVVNFLLNYMWSFKKVGLSAKRRFLTALIVTIITIPWFFLLPAGNGL